MEQRPETNDNIMRKIFFTSRMHVKKNQKAYWRNRITGIRQPPDIRIRFLKTRISGIRVQNQYQVQPYFQ